MGKVVDFHLSVTNHMSTLFQTEFVWKIYVIKRVSSMLQAAGLRSGESCWLGTTGGLRANVNSFDTFLFGSFGGALRFIEDDGDMLVDEDMALLLLFSMFVLHDLLFGGSGDNISLVLSHQTIWLNRTFFLGVSIPVSDIIVFVVGLSLSFPLNWWSYNARSHSHVRFSKRGPCGLELT